MKILHIFVHITWEIQKSRFNIILNIYVISKENKL